MDKKIKFTIITATTGITHLTKLLQSINNLLDSSEKYDIDHVIIVDGDKFKSRTENILNSVNPSNHIKRYIVQLPFNTGGTGYLCNKIYAGMSHIVDGDYVIFLDDDNWVEPNHIEHYYNLIVQRYCATTTTATTADNNTTSNTTNEVNTTTDTFNKLNKFNELEWLYCLRNIIDTNDNFVCKDLCESLGFIHSVYYNNSEYMIDTNCFCVSKNVLIQHCWIWDRKSTSDTANPDRLFSRKLMETNKNFICTFEYTVNYRIASREQSTSQTIFTRGNDNIREYMKHNIIPWENGCKNIIAIKYIDRKMTDELIEKLYLTTVTFFSNDSPNINSNDIIYVNAFSPYIPNSIKIFNVNDVICEKN